MKYLLPILLIISKLSMAQRAGEVKIKGIIDSGISKEIYLIERGPATSNPDNYIVLDSATIETNGKFVLTTTIREAKYLSIIGKEKGWLSILAEPQNKYLVNGNYKELWKAKIQGNFTNKFLSELEDILRPYKKLNNQLVDSISYYKKDSARFVFFKEKNIENRKIIVEEQIRFIKKNKSNVAGLFIYNSVFTMLSTIQKKQLFQLLSQKNKQHSIAKKIEIELFEKPKMSFDYKLLKPLKSITLKNETRSDTGFVLICFWATWCSPCIKSLPEIDSLYASSKNAEIISVSFDQSVKFPQEYFQKHNYQWNSFWDEKRSNGDIGILYSIDFLPQYFLCDKMGKIVLRTNEFAKVLSRIK